MTLLPDSLATRLTFSWAGIFMLFFVLAFLFFYLFIDATLQERIDEDLRDDIEELRILYESDGLTPVLKEIRREVAANEPGVLFFRLMDDAGEVDYSSDTSHWPSLVWGEAPVPGGFMFSNFRGQEDDYMTRSVSGWIAPGLRIQTGESMEERDEFMGLLVQMFAATFFIVLLLSMLVGWFMARKALRGVEEVSQAAEDVANGELDRKVMIRNRGKEIDRLVVTFNVMINRIQALITGMREMTDNIAHDMRSPLARIRTNAESALYHARTLEDYRSAAVDTLEECDRLLQMVNTTLDVAEAEAGIADLEKVDIDASAMVADACELFEPMAEDLHIVLAHEIEPGVRVQGNLPQLQRMFANLLDNALKYSPSGGRAVVSLTSDETRVVITISDTGAGIPEEEQPHIFERYYRCDQSRSKPGFGLGLSFARAVARSHGGDVHVSSTTGKGSRFTVILPRHLSSTASFSCQTVIFRQTAG